MCEQAVGRTARGGEKALMARGGPSRGRARPAMRPAPAALRLAPARAGGSRKKGLRPRARSYAAICASASSLALKLLARNPSRACANVRPVRSLIGDPPPGLPGLSLDHLGDKKKVVLACRCVAHDALADLPVGDLVLTLLERHRSDRGHRLDALDIDLGQLLHESQHGIDLALQVRDLLVGDRDARQMRDAADGLGIDGHGDLMAWCRVAQ